MQKSKTKIERIFRCAEKPYEITFTAELIRLAKQLPISLGGRSPDCLAAFYEALSSESRKSFDNVASRTDPAFFETFRNLRLFYSEFAYPGSGWPSPNAEDILEELPVGIEPVGRLLYMINGQRFVSSQQGDIWTFTEFEQTFGETVAQHVRGARKRLTRRLDLAQSRLSSDTPHIYSVCAGRWGKKASAEHIEIVAYSEEQVDAFLRRKRLIGIDRTTTPAILQGGAYSPQG